LEKKMACHLDVVHQTLENHQGRPCRALSALSLTVLKYLTLAVPCRKQAEQGQTVGNTREIARRHDFESDC
jgi:hypothetical protein